MKLAYLWIKKYKNIEKQGFNFSNKYRFKVEMQQNEINIEKTELAYSILNYFEMDLKLIIGKNGSGKSSLLEAFMLIQYGMKNKDLKYFIILEDNDKFYIQKNFSETIKWKDSKYKELERFHKDIQNIYLNFGMDTFSPTFKNNLVTSFDMIYDYEEVVREKNILAYPNKKSDKIDLNNFYRDLIKMYFRVKKEYNMSDEEIEEKILSVFTKEEKNFSFKIEEFKLEFDMNIYQLFFNNIANKNLIKAILKVKNPISDNLDIDKLYDLSVIFILLGIIEKGYENLISDSFIIDTKLKNILKMFKNEVDKMIKSKNLYHINFNDEKSEEELEKELVDIGKLFLFSLQEHNIFSKMREIKLAKSFTQTFFNTFPTLKEVVWYIDYINGHYNIQKNSWDLFLKWSNLDDGLIKTLLENLPPFIHINLKDKKGREFLDLSFGEKLFNFLIYIMMYFVKFYSNKEKRTITILYDEFDIGMHPEMQRKFIKLLFNIHKVIKKHNPNINIKYILATHSPLILSDIPSINVILLKNGKEENKNLNSFGGNIFELYNDSFFLYDSIGKFSEDIINIISIVMDFIIYLEKREAFYLRKMFNEWYDGENLTDEDYKKQDDDFLNKIKDCEISLKKLLKNFNNYDSIINLIITKPEEIESIIEIIGEPVIKNYLKRKYKEYIESLNKKCPEYLI